MKPFAKSCVRFAAQVVVAPFVAWHKLVGAVVGKDRALEWHTQWLALLPGYSGQLLRRAFLSWALAECHPSAVICFGTLFSKSDARIGENVYIGSFCSFGTVVIEHDVLIANGVQVPSGARMHGIADLTVPIRLQPGVWECVTVGAGTWIGSAAVVMADVGKDCVVGAGAVVTKPVPDAVIVGGVPAKVLKTRAAAAADVLKRVTADG